jgi:hypothetical protein
MDPFEKFKAAQKAGWAQFAPLQVFNQWGDPTIVRERLGAAVHDILFDCGRVEAPALSVAHYRELTERTAGPVLKLVESLSTSDPGKLAEFRTAFDALTAQYYDRNIVRQDYLMTRAVKN